MIELMQGGGQSSVYPFPGDQYLGQVASADFIDGAALANLTGFSNGLVISANNAIGWLKFKKQEGQTLYVSKRSLRYRLSWNQLNAANMVDGSKIIAVKGELFKVRLMLGAEKDPTDWAVGDTQANPAIVAPSEWNRFIYRVSNRNPGPGSQMASFTDAEIGIAGGATLGRMTICKEVLATNSGIVVARANSALTNFNYVLKSDGSASSTQDHYGWRPVLEYVAPAPPPGEFPGSGPGPKTLAFGDEQLGYFNEVTTAELVTHAQLRTHLGVNWTLRADSGWFKFFHKGVVKYISKNTFATGVTWDQVYQAGAAYGTNDNGKYGSVHQRKPLSLIRDGKPWTLVPHLITSSSVDPTTTGIALGPDNEWYDLMMRVCAGTHPNAGAWAQNTLAQAAMHASHTVIETASSRTDMHLICGYPGIDSVAQWNAKSNATGYSQHIRLTLSLEGNPYVAPEGGGEPTFWLDPSDQPDGSTTIVNKSAKAINVTNSGVVVAAEGPRVGVKSMYFNKASVKYLRMPGAAMGAVTSKNFQIDFSFKPDGQPAGLMPLVAQWAQSSGNAGFLTNLLANGQQAFHYGAFNNDGAMMTPPVNPDLLNWMKYSIRRLGNVFEMWQNDVMVASFTSATVNPLTIDWVIGAYMNASNIIPAAGTVPLGGWLADFRVYEFYKG